MPICKLVDRALSKPLHTHTRWMEQRFAELRVAMRQPGVAVAAHAAAATESSAADPAGVQAAAGTASIAQRPAADTVSVVAAAANKSIRDRVAPGRRPADRGSSSSGGAMASAGLVAGAVLASVAGIRQLVWIIQKPEAAAAGDFGPDSSFSTGDGGGGRRRGGGSDAGWEQLDAAFAHVRCCRVAAVQHEGSNSSSCQEDLSCAKL